MTAGKIQSPFLRASPILVAAILVFGTQAWAENRLPANRTYLVFIQGLEDNPLEGDFGCIVFTTDEELIAGDDSGEWFIDNKLSVSPDQRAIVFQIDVVDDDEDPPLEIRIDGLCWLDNMGPLHSLSCSGHGVGDGVMLNFALTGRPLAGGASPEALSRCEEIAARFN